MLNEWQQHLLFPAGKKGDVDLIDHGAAVYHLDQK